MIDLTWYEWIIWLVFFFGNIGFWIYGLLENYKSWFPNQEKNDIIKENKQGD